jgi:hypothetical protein
LTHPVRGLDSYAEMVRLLNEEKDAIKVFVEVATSYLINRSEGEQDIPADAKKTSFRPCWKVHAPGKHAVDRRTGIYEMSSSS